MYIIRYSLNNRRAVFDLPPREVNYNQFVEEMLTKALSFTLDSLLENPERLVSLFDATCYLQILRLEELDFSSPSCFCLFVNIYHCLLQHALLLTVNGPLNRKSCGHFMRTTCVEESFRLVFDFLFHQLTLADFYLQRLCHRRRRLFTFRASVLCDSRRDVQAAAS